MSKVSCFTVKFEVPSGPAPERQHYRGFDLLGRWGPQSGRVGQKGHGKTRHFRSKGCFFPGREAGCLSRARNTIEEWKHRVATSAVIYVRFEHAISGIHNTHEDGALRIAPGAVIHVRFEHAVSGVHNTHEDGAVRKAERTRFTVILIPNSQHSRGSEATDRSRADKTRHFGHRRCPNRRVFGDYGVGSGTECRVLSSDWGPPPPPRAGWPKAESQDSHRRCKIVM